METVDQARVDSFLGGGPIAVVGVSDDPRNFGRTIVRELREHGHDVVAVHPAGGMVEGVARHADLASVPGDLDGVIVMVAAPQAAEAVRQCVDRGVRKVWLFRGIGGVGAVSDDALALCEEHGIEVVAGACPLMFLEPVGWFHRMHRSARRMRGSLVVSAA